MLNSIHVQFPSAPSKPVMLTSIARKFKSFQPGVGKGSRSVGAMDLDEKGAQRGQLLKW